jgi:hypothetical protein
MEYTINAKFVNTTGHVRKANYADGSLALLITNYEGRETLSTNLGAYGLVAPEGHVYVKGVSEHEGLPEALELAGIASKIPNGRVTFGPFDSYAWLMKVEV